jgi:hypothetical protein
MTILDRSNRHRRRNFFPAIAAGSRNRFGCSMARDASARKTATVAGAD